MEIKQKREREDNGLVLNRCALKVGPWCILISDEFLEFPALYEYFPSNVQTFCLARVQLQVLHRDIKSVARLALLLRLTLNRACAWTRERSVGNAPTVIPTKTLESKFLKDKTQHTWKQSWHWIYGLEQSNAETRAIRRSIAGPMFAEELWQCSIEQHFRWSKINPCWNLVLLKCRWDRPTYWWDRVQTAQWPDCKDAFFLRSDDLRIQDESESRGLSIIFQNQRPGKKTNIKMLHRRGKTRRFWGCDCGSTYLCRGDSGVG